MLTPSLSRAGVDLSSLQESAERFYFSQPVVGARRAALAARGAGGARVRFHDDDPRHASQREAPPARGASPHRLAVREQASSKSSSCRSASW